MSRTSGGIEFVEWTPGDTRVGWQMQDQPTLLAFDGKLSAAYAVCDVKNNTAGEVSITGKQVVMISRHLDTEDCGNVGYEIRRTYLNSASTMKALLNREFSLVRWQRNQPEPPPSKLD